MGWNGSGTVVRSNGDNTGTALWQQDAADGDNIDASRHDVHDEDLADAIQNCITKDGQNVPTAALPMGDYNHTGVGNATARTHYAAAGQVQDSAVTWGGTAGGSANTYTITLTPAITAYATGQRFAFLVDAAKGNSGAATLNVNGLGAKAIKRDTTPDALNSGDMPAGWIADVVYDGTQFILLNPALLAANVVTGAMIRLANTQYLRARNAAGGADIDVLVVSALDNTQLWADTGKLVSLGIKGGNYAYYNGSTLAPGSDGDQDLGTTAARFQLACVKNGISMPSNNVAAATPTAAQISAAGFSIISSGGASRAVRLPTATAGDVCILVNTSTNDVLVNTKNAATDTVNGAAWADGTVTLPAWGAWIFWAYAANKWAANT